MKPREKSIIKNAFVRFHRLYIFQEKVEFELEKLLSQQVHLEADLRGLSQSAVLPLTSAENEAEKLSSVIGFTAKLADGVAAKVKQLDLAKVRTPFSMTCSILC